jgi:hypothetical protein
VSYPTTSEEATKVILSLLLTSPACVEFDDMDTDWIPHGTIKRMLTAETITDRILGVSKTATVSTRTLFLGSGNNVGPIRDLLRRVVTIHIDPRCATPATMTYKGFPVDKVRQNRGVYVSAVLTIIQAWCKAGSPRTTAGSIVTFGGAWSDYCRYPLMWLGHPDPATALLEQVRHDPDADALSGLMTEWRAVFGSTPTTVRKAVESAIYNNPNLLDAMRECPVEERGEINRSKLGWLLKKNANRIVGGLEFQQAEADGRTASRVVAARVSDKRVLRLIRAFLNAGVMEDGLVHPVDEGTPQGGPLSPLLSNLVLDDLDKELSRRGHRFCRYADDCNIYVRSRRAGERVMASVTRFLTGKLKLKVNEAKSAVALTGERKFLGFTIENNGAERRIAPKALSKFKVKIRDMTSRTRGRSLEQIVEDLAPYLIGWRGYFGFCQTPRVLTNLEAWIRRRLRSYLWRQWRNGHNRFKELRRRGVLKFHAAVAASSPTGCWRMSSHPSLQSALRNHVFDDLGLPRLYVAVEA